MTTDEHDWTIGRMRQAAVKRGIRFSEKMLTTKHIHAGSIPACDKLNTVYFLDFEVLDGNALRIRLFYDRKRGTGRKMVIVSKMFAKRESPTTPPDVLESFGEMLEEIRHRHRRIFYYDSSEVLRRSIARELKAIRLAVAEAGRRVVTVIEETGAETSEALDGALVTIGAGLDELHRDAVLGFANLAKKPRTKATA